MGVLERKEEDCFVLLRSKRARNRASIESSKGHVESEASNGDTWWEKPSVGSSAVKEVGGKVGGNNC